MNIFLIAASIADIGADRGDTFRGVSTLFINSKPAVINSLRKSKNPPSLLVFFVVVPFTKIRLFSKDLIIFKVSFISLFVRVIPETVIDEIHFFTI